MIESLYEEKLKKKYQVDDETNNKANANQKEKRN